LSQGQITGANSGLDEAVYLGGGNEVWPSLLWRCELEVDSKNKKRANGLATHGEWMAPSPFTTPTKSTTSFNFDGRLQPRTRVMSTFIISENGDLPLKNEEGHFSNGFMVTMRDTNLTITEG
jgi:hypothetical protein